MPTIEGSDEWTLDGVLHELGKINSSMQDRHFAFILGAGASFTSGIPTGKSLAQEWLRELHLRQCLDSSPVEHWIDRGSLGIEGLTYEKAAEFYPKIFERRFRYDREAGYAALEKAMEGKSPSLGYSLLAEIIQNTRHKVVVTTNFDNLVADALAMHAHQSPLVVAHESLAGFVRPQLRRPLVAKIHRDLFLEPQNDEIGVGTLDRAWASALRKLFQYFTPIVVGYGGNDGSLMGLLDSLKTGEISGRMVWCYRDDDPNEAACSVLQKHGGIRVRIPGFDDFMLRLAATLIRDFDVASIADRIESLGKTRAQRYREQSEDLQKRSVDGTPEQKKSGDVLERSAEAGRTWWSWELRAQAEADPAVRERIYQEGLSHFPNSAKLTAHYADFLLNVRGNLDAAEENYKKAVEFDAADASLLARYGLFLANRRGDIEGGEKLLRKAAEADGTNSGILVTFGEFLSTKRGEIEAAEAVFKRALELDPTSGYALGAYSRFLIRTRRDFDAAEGLFKIALEQKPTDANLRVQYAAFLEHERQDLVRAEEVLLQAKNLEPTNRWVIRSLARLLARQPERIDDAKSAFERAFAASPRDGLLHVSYALFLQSQLKDMEEAARHYQKAIELGPNDLGTLDSYGAFLANTLGELDQAEAVYRRALELYPLSANTRANLTALLLTRGDDKSLAAARDLLAAFPEICARVPSQVLAEALLYQCLLEEVLSNRESTACLGALKGLFTLGYRRGSWNFSGVLKSMLPRVAEDRHGLYTAIAAAILDANLVLALEQFDVWREVPARDPFEETQSERDSR